MSAIPSLQLEPGKVSLAGVWTLAAMQAGELDVTVFQACPHVDRVSVTVPFARSRFRSATSSSSA